MAISVSWDEQAIRYEFVGLWDWAELEAVHADVFDVIRAETGTISLIFDLTQSIDLPIGALSAMRRMFTYAPPNLGLLVVITTDDAATMTFGMLGNFDATLGKRIIVRDTLTAARHALHDFYASH